MASNAEAQSLSRGPTCRLLRPFVVNALKNAYPDYSLLNPCGCRLSDVTLSLLLKKSQHSKKTYACHTQSYNLNIRIHHI